MNQSILFIIPSINYGGAEMLLLQQVKGLSDKGWKCCVAVLSNRNEELLIDQLSLPQEQMLIFPSPSSVLNFSALSFAWKHKKALVAFAKIHQVSNIVAHLPLAHFWGRLVKLKMPATRLLVYHHSMQYQASPLDTVAKKLFNGYQKLLAQKADDTSICISESVKQNISAHFVTPNPVILYNAVHDKGFNPAGNRNTRQEGKIKLLLPGRLHPAKGHLFFLPIFQQIVKEGRWPVCLEIAGGGPLEKEISSFIIQNGLQEQVNITGFLSNEKLIEQMANADLVMIPSVSEGLGIVGIEAMMLGKTVIASDAGGLKEVFQHGDTGYLFTAGNADSCLNVLRSVLSNFPGTLLAPARLRQEYEKRFSFASYIEHFEGLLKKHE